MPDLYVSNVSNFSWLSNKHTLVCVTMDSAPAMKTDSAVSMMGTERRWRCCLDSATLWVNHPAGSYSRIRGENLEQGKVYEGKAVLFLSGILHLVESGDDEKIPKVPFNCVLWCGTVLSVVIECQCFISTFYSVVVQQKRKLEDFIYF